MEVNKDYIGQVVYNKDMTYSGRCKIRVFGLFDELPEENIPWFSPMSMNVFSSYGGGNLSVPKINDIVRVRFSSDDYYSGEYTSIQNIDPTLIDQIKSDYIGTHVVLFDSDEELLVIYQPASGYKMSLKGSVIRIGADGVIQLSHQNNSSVVELTESDINITAAASGANINIFSSNEVNINAPTVHIDSNAVDVGKGAKNHAVKGEKLVSVLKEMAMEIAAKTPQGSALAARTFSEILSTDVRVK